MAYEKIVKIIKTLAKKTTEGEVEWEETNNEGVFQTAFPGYAVRVRTRPNPDADEQDYLLQIYNENGSLIEEVADTDLIEEMPVPEAYNVMKALYDGARRRAMGIEAALDQILEKLGEDNTPF